MLMFKIKYLTHYKNLGLSQYIYLTPLFLSSKHLAGYAWSSA